MQLRPDLLDAHLKKTLASLYVITSDEHLLLLEASDKIRQAAKQQGYTQRQILIVEREEFKWSELQAADCALSLFGDRKFIELRIPKGRPGKEGSQTLQHYATKAHPDNITLITLPRLDAASKKSAWVTALQKAAVYIDIPLVGREQLDKWIASRLASQNQQAESEGLAFLTTRVEGNLLAAHQEIRKLSLLYPEGSLSFEQIRDAVLNVARYSIFQLSEAMLTGDTPRLVRILESLKGEGEPLPLVLSVVTEDIRTLLKLHTGMTKGLSPDALIKNMRIWGAREKALPAALKRTSPSALIRSLRLASQTDKIIKGLQTDTLLDDAWDTLLQLCLSVALTSSPP